MSFMCKACKKAFRKDVTEEFEEADEHCPHCDNHYVIEAKEAADKGKLVIEFKAEKGHEHKMFQDDREKQRDRVLQKDLWEDDEESDDDFKVDPNMAYSMQVAGKPAKALTSGHAGGGMF